MSKKPMNRSVTVKQIKRDARELQRQDTSLTHDEALRLAAKQQGFEDYSHFRHVKKQKAEADSDRATNNAASNAPRRLYVKFAIVGSSQQAVAAMLARMVQAENFGPISETPPDEYKIYRASVLDDGANTTLKIDVEGEEEKDIHFAAPYILEGVGTGNYTGFDSNDTGRYHFELEFEEYRPPRDLPDDLAGLDWKEAAEKVVAQLRDAHPDLIVRVDNDSEKIWFDAGRGWANDPTWDERERLRVSPGYYGLKKDEADRLYLLNEEPQRFY